MSTSSNHIQEREENVETRQRWKLSQEKLAKCDHGADPLGCSEISLVVVRLGGGGLASAGAYGVLDC
jgi:hypothetical protein